MVSAKIDDRVGLQFRPSYT